MDLANLACLALLIIIRRIKIPHAEIQPENHLDDDKKKLIDGHDIVMMILLGVIAIRSAAWNIFQIIHEENYYWLLAIAISAFTGKLIGGVISDRIGWRLYGLLSLLASLPLLSFFKHELILFCIGIGLLQSAIPANTAMMISYFKGQKEKGIAYSFGSAIIIGLILIIPAQLISVNYIISISLLLLVFASAVIFRKRNSFR